jgi:hypothetical protein
MSSLAEYNNNPGNIRPAKGVTYEGMIGVDDKGFAIFQKPEQGQQALVNDLTHKIEKRGIKTPNDFVNVYSPAGEENTEESRDNYKMHIAHSLGLKSTSDSFPDNAVNNLAKAVSSFEGGTWQQAPAEAVSEAPAASAVASAPVPPGTSEVTQSTAPYAVIGGAIGAVGATALEASKKVLPFIPNWANLAIQNPINPNKASTRASLQRYANSQIAPNLRLPLGELEKVTGGNKIRTMSEVQNALDSIKEVPEVKGTKPVYKPSSAGSTVLTDTGKVLPYSTPGRPALDLTPYEYEPSLMNNAVDRVKSAGEAVKGALPSFGRVGIGALGGALAGKQAYDAFDQYQKEGGGWHVPSGRNAAQFASALGGGLSVLPFGVTQAAGLGLLQAPELAYQGYDALTDLNTRRKAATKEDVDRMLTNVDAMGNPY